MPNDPHSLSPQQNTWTATQTREQFSAIVWLRWRIFLNAFRRKGGTGELVGRILLVPVLAGFAIGPSIGAAFGAFYFTQGDRIGSISWLLWATFVYCMFLNMQLGQSGTVFDPTELIRFPLAARNYIAIRLCFGLLTPANVIGTLMAASIALGVIVAQPGLWLVAILALAVFALAIVLFSRMVFAWVDRWLATRRAREIYTGIFFAVMLLGQWANFTFNPGLNHGHHGGLSPEHMQLAMNFVHSVQPYLVWLPPGLTANALTAAVHNNLPQATGLIFICALYAAVFFAIFALRMRTEFRGENFSDNAGSVSRKTIKPATAPVSAHAAGLAASRPERTFGFSPVVLAQLGKELLYMRRNVGILYGVVAPIVLVLIFASRFSSRGGTSAWVFPGAVAYTMLTISTFSYNSFGLEGTGSQFYFLAPVRMRDVVLAKNIMIFLLAIAEVGLTFVVISWSAGMPPVSLAVSAVLWAVATMLVSTIVGNLRSFTTPKKITTARMGNKQVSQLSALIGMGILLGSAAVAAVPIGLAFYLDKTWIMLPFFLVFALVAAFFYERSLRSIDRYALAHREELFEELCKAA
jgi:ABC-2 type transport system permease protein